MPAHKLTRLPTLLSTAVLLTLVSACEVKTLGKDGIANNTQTSNNNNNATSNSNTPEKQCEPTFCVELKQSDGQVTLNVETLEHSAQSIEFSYTSSGLSTTSTNPVWYVSTAPGSESAIKFDITGASWQLEYNFSYITGIVNAQHDPDGNQLYRLPYAIGQSFPVSQGYGGTVSHEQQNALDFAMPEGTAIHAARAGRVVGIEESFI